MRSNNVGHNQAQYITEAELLRHMGGTRHQVAVYDLDLAELGPNKTLTTRPLSASKGDQVSFRIDRGALHANTPEINATSPTGGVRINIETQPVGAIGAASKVHVNVIVDPLAGGLDHRTIYLEDQRGARLLAVRIPVSEKSTCDAIGGARPSGIGMPAPFTDADNRNGINKMLSVGQELTVVLDENPTTGRRWAFADNSDWFQLLSSNYYPGGDAVGSGGKHVFRFRVKGEGFCMNEGKTSVPAALSIYQLSPGETLDERLTRGDGSGPEFYMNTVINRSAAASMLAARS
jgi:predicted secreted protein